ncbi:MAG: GyrI-like domain-containing protein [Chloroflexota bacterium]
MSLKEFGIEHKHLAETLAVTRRLVVKERSEIQQALAELAQQVPEEQVAGAPFCVFQFVTSIKDGDDVEIGIPVRQPLEGAQFSTRRLPALQVLSLVHRAAPEKLGETYRTLYGRASELGITSDEFCREVYLSDSDPQGPGIEAQFVIHAWNDLLAKSLVRVLGEGKAQDVLQGSPAIGLETSLDERFGWLRGAVQRLDVLADEYQKYDALSSCAHVFPASQVAKLRAAYEGARASGAGPIQAVDAVLDFMEADPGWSDRPRREGNVIYSVKQPRDPKGYAAATNDLERRRAYCFCPQVRNHMDQGMPVTFCYCGAGWFRQQWEGALGQPVTVEIVKSVLRGDEACEFAMRLPDEL